MGKEQESAFKDRRSFDDDFPEAEMTPIELPDPVLINSSAVEPGSRDVVPKESPFGPALEDKLRGYLESGAGRHDKKVYSETRDYASLATRIAKVIQQHFAVELRERKQGFLIASRLVEKEEDGKVKLAHARSEDILPPKSDMDESIKKTIDNLVSDGPALLRISHPAFEVESNAENPDKKDLPFFDFSIDLAALPSAKSRGELRARIECSSTYSDADDSGLKSAFRYTRHIYALRKVVRELFLAYNRPLAEDSVLEHMLSYLKMENLFNPVNHRLPPIGVYGEMAYSMVVELRMVPDEADVSFHDQSGFVQLAADIAKRDAAILRYTNKDASKPRTKHTIAKVGTLQPGSVSEEPEDFEVAKCEEQTVEIVGKDRKESMTTQFYVTFYKKY